MQPVMFIIPVIALLLVAIFYLYFYKKTESKPAFKHFIIIVMILSFLLNLTWEIAQAPLYANFTNNNHHVIFCILASIADAAMVLLLYLGLAFLYKTPFWIQLFTVSRVLTVMLIGGAGAILSEMGHVAGGNWTYAAAMPVIPIVKVGLSPVLQFIAIPAPVYYLGFHILKPRELDILQ